MNPEELRNIINDLAFPVSIVTVTLASIVAGYSLKKKSIVQARERAAYESDPDTIRAHTEATQTLLGDPHVRGYLDRRAELANQYVQRNSLLDYGHSDLEAYLNTVMGPLPKQLSQRE